MDDDSLDFLREMEQLDEQLDERRICCVVGCDRQANTQDRNDPSRYLCYSHSNSDEAIKARMGAILSRNRYRD
jgi:hypothetical protein